MFKCLKRNIKRRRHNCLTSPAVTKKVTACLLCSLRAILLMHNVLRDAVSVDCPWACSPRRARTPYPRRHAACCRRTGFRRTALGSRHARRAYTQRRRAHRRAPLKRQADVRDAVRDTVTAFTARAFADRATARVLELARRPPRLPKAIDRFMLRASAARIGASGVCDLLVAFKPDAGPRPETARHDGLSAVRQWVGDEDDLGRGEALWHRRCKKTHSAGA
jgi:hypothetical protein